MPTYKVNQMGNKNSSSTNKSKGAKENAADHGQFLSCKWTVNGKLKETAIFARAGKKAEKLLLYDFRY